MPLDPTLPGLPGVPTDSQIPGIAQMLTQAMFNRQWLMAAAGALMVVVFLANKFVIPLMAKDPELKAKVLPWVSVVLAITAGIATWILNPSVPPTEIFSTALQIALTAGGTWELLGKSTLGKLMKPKDPAAPAPETPKADAIVEAPQAKADAIVEAPQAKADAIVEGK